ILEYQTSEYWWAKTWGPARFLSLVRLAEEFSIRSATHLAVVSDVLRDELMERGVAQEKIIVNPAAVDPERFRPGVGGKAARKELGFSDADIVVCFSGSFSYFHGMPVLSEAIRLLLRREGAGPSPRVRFLLVGDLEQLGTVLYHGETAWLVPAGDQEALAGAVEVLAGDPDLRERLGSRARVAAAQNHTWRQNALRLLAAIPGPTRVDRSDGR